MYTHTCVYIVKYTSLNEQIEQLNRKYAWKSPPTRKKSKWKAHLTDHTDECRGISMSLCFSPEWVNVKIGYMLKWQTFGKLKLFVLLIRTLTRIARTACTLAHSWSENSFNTFSLRTSVMVRCMCVYCSRSSNSIPSLLRLTLLLLLNTHSHTYICYFWGKFFFG